MARELLVFDTTGRTEYPEEALELLSDLPVRFENFLQANQWRFTLISDDPILVFFSIVADAKGQVFPITHCRLSDFYVPTPS